MNRILPIALALSSVAGTVSFAVAAGAGGIAGGTPNGPDVIVSNLDGLQLYGIEGDMSCYAMTTVSCNLGEADAEWFAFTNHHPVIAQNMYRLKNGRFEQIGLAWLKHGFCAADSCFNACGSPCEPNGSCDFLGTHATDTYDAFLNADQTNLGPRSEVNAWTGFYPYPPLIPNWGQTGNEVYKRLQVHTVDVNPALNAARCTSAKASTSARMNNPSTATTTCRIDRQSSLLRSAHRGMCRSPGA